MQQRLACGAFIASMLTGFAASVLAQNRPVTQYFYDANGNLTTAVDGLSRSTSQAYDALNRLRTITQPPPAALQPNPVIQLEVNARDDLTRVTDPRTLATVYTVNGFGEATTQVSPDTGSTIRTFDAAGNLKTSKDARNKTTTYTYDAINRLTQAKYGDNTVSNYFYDEGVNGIGRLTRMVDPGSITTVWTYTPQGRVATRTQTIGSGTSARTHALGYSYNPTTGQLASVTYPSGRIVTYVYGAGSKDIESVQVDGIPVASGIVWHPLGDVKQMTLGNGQAWATALDQDGRITSYTLGGVVYTVVWDAANRIVAINHATNPSLNQTFGYDNLDRITGFASTGRSQSFGYDLTGNLTTKFDQLAGSDPANYTYTIDPASNRMTAIASMGIGFTIDAVGNRTNDGRIGYLYNARGRLYRVTITNAAITQTFNYLINGLNQRVRKTGPSSVIPQGTRIFVYDDAGLLLGEYDNLGRARTEHIWLGSRPIAAITYTYVSSNLTPATTTVSYVETDHLGTPRLITNASRQPRWSWVSAPYGDTLANENPAALGVYPYNLRFAGQYFDIETNHHYNWHRDYEATTGRYLQSDPIGLIGGVQTYGYVDDHPISSSDPTGLFAGVDDAIFIAGGTITGLLGQGIADALSGRLSGWEDYVGSAVGGAALGESLLYLGPVAAGLVGGAVTNATKQGLKNLTGKQCGFNTVSFGVDAVIGGAFGFIPGRPRIDAVNSGRNSMNALYRQMSTKFKNGTISHVTPTTAGKMFFGRAYDTAVLYGVAGGAVPSYFGGPFIPGYSDTCVCPGP